MRGNDVRTGVAFEGAACQRFVSGIYQNGISGAEVDAWFVQGVFGDIHLVVAKNEGVAGLCGRFVHEENSGFKVGGLDERLRASAKVVISLLRTPSGL